jgi:hypothetical protein
MCHSTRFFQGFLLLSTILGWHRYNRGSHVYPQTLFHLPEEQRKKMRIAVQHAPFSTVGFGAKRSISNNGEQPICNPYSKIRRVPATGSPDSGPHPMVKE